MSSKSRFRRCATAERTSNLLLRHFIRDASDAHRIPCPTLTNAAEALLARYAWPGNVRQLKNVTERLVVRHAGHAITPDELPSEIRDYTTAAAAPVMSAPPVSSTSSITARISGEPATDTRSALWTRLMAGENFWAVVCEPFKARDLTRDDVRAIVHRGLLETLGSYRGLLRLFHLPESDYKRFLAFLSTHDCHLPFHVYRGTPIDQTANPTRCADSGSRPVRARRRWAAACWCSGLGDRRGDVHFTEVKGGDEGVDDLRIEVGARALHEDVFRVEGGHRFAVRAVARRANPTRRQRK